MKTELTKNSIIVTDLDHFDIEQTFTCGQCFRWDKNLDGSFTGVAMGKVLTLSADGGKFIFHNTSREDFHHVWENYFDFLRDYGEIKESLMVDETMQRAVKSGSGIRILKKDLWETIISFIISASNNIPRIKKIIASLCENFGEKISYNYYSFPSPEMLSGITEADLIPIRAGFRAKYIVDAVNKVTCGEINLNSMHLLDTASARNELLKIKGVGEKVADCILLFALGRTEVFPVDVWIKNTMQKLYPEYSASLSQIRQAGRKIFGCHCGIAQQYLFYYARENGGNL